MNGQSDGKPKTKIVEIIDQFAREEIGNRLSQFAVLSLKALIQEQLNKLVEAEDARPKDNPT